MKKGYLINIAMVLSIVVLFMSCDSRSADYRIISVEAPFPMKPICEYIFPERDYVITDFGAVADTMYVIQRLLSKLFRLVPRQVEDGWLFLPVSG